MKYVLVIITVVILSMIFMFFKSELIVDDSSSQVKIKTLFMGEYFSPVKELSISEKINKKVILKLIAKTNKSRMHTVTIDKGVNNFHGLYLDLYNQVYPDFSPYHFKKNITYIVNVKWSFLYATDEFIIK